MKEELKGLEVQKYIKDYTDIIVEGMEANPREIKRFINNFILVNQISEKETEPNKLLAVLIIQFRWEFFYKDLTKYKKPFLEQTAVIVDSKEMLKKEGSRKTAKESWNFFDLIEAHLKDEQLRNFLEGTGRILFEIQDLDPYIHFSASVVLEKEETEKSPSKLELLDLLVKGKIKEFESIRPYPHVDLSFTTLYGDILPRVDLSGADLRQADLRETDLMKATFREADLTRADLREASLTGADMRKAVLQFTSLFRTDLGYVDLRGADLRGANLREAILSQANLQDIVIDDLTVFERTVIEGARNLSPEVMDQLRIVTTDGVQRATSKRLSQNEKSKGKT